MAISRTEKNNGKISFHSRECFIMKKAKQKQHYAISTSSLSFSITSDPVDFTSAVVIR